MSTLSTAQKQIQEHYAAVALSASCGQSVNRGCCEPLAQVELRPGEIVLDLGCGGGAEALEAARQVGPTGFVYGLDMTAEMLDLARRRAHEQQLENIDFLACMVEAIPLPASSVDVVISNCVLNLCDNKPAALAEALRVLKPASRLVAADILAVESRLPPKQLRRLAEVVGCSNGVLLLRDYAQLLRTVGFTDSEIRPYRHFTFQYISQKAVERHQEDLLKGLDPNLAHEVLASAYIYARKG